MNDLYLWPKPDLTRLIKEAIANGQTYDSLVAEKELPLVFKKVMEDLSGSEIRGFVYRCFQRGNEAIGLVLVDEAVEYALKTKRMNRDRPYREPMEAAIGALSALSHGNNLAKNKLFDLLKHRDPEIVTLTVDNLGRSANIDNLRAICELMLRGNPDVGRTAILHIEACTRDAAFRKDRNQSQGFEEAAEEFLRQILVPLEKTHKKLLSVEKGTSHVTKRTFILVAMIYNEILDCTDWRRSKKEHIDERIYYALEKHLIDEIAPAAMPWLMKMLGKKELEPGIEISALNTLGRIGNAEHHRESVASWLDSYMESKKETGMIDLAKKIAEAYGQGQRYSAVSAVSPLDGSGAVVPRSTGVPMGAKR